MNKKNKYTTLLFALLMLAGFGTLQAQNPAPASSQAAPILLKGATVHVGNGEVIENGYVGFTDGKITEVGSGAPSDESRYDVRDVSGQHIYPGFIMANSRLGIEEVSSVNDMSDYNETGDLNPNVRSKVAYNTDSRVIPTYRYTGILVAESTPAGGVISGSSSVMQLDAWNWEDATLQEDAAVHMNWPGRYRRSFDFSTYSFSYGPNPNYEGTVQEIRKMMRDAVSYGELSNVEENIKLEALQGLFDGSKLLVIHSNQEKSIIEGVTLAKEWGVQRIAVATDAAALHIADFLADHEVPVVLPPVHSTPDRTDDDYDLPYKLAGLLTEKGVKVSLSHSGMLANGRNLPFYAGTCVAWGMEKEEALKMITMNPAEMLGMDDRLGSIEQGKDATLFVSTGDALDMRTNDLSYAFIGGREITLDAMQQELYEKFSDKYGHEK